MKEYDVYFHEKKIKYRQDHELFYTTMSGQSVWMETVQAETVQEAFRIARERHFVNCIQQARCGAIVSPLALAPKYMYIDEPGGCMRYVPYSTSKS
jgi:hypothetical protein